MKRLALLIGLVLFCYQSVLAEENFAKSSDTNNIISDKATQIIEMEDNKINIIVMKQPLNEKSNQKIVLKRNWLGVYIQVNGKIKVNPLASTYEVQ